LTEAQQLAETQRNRADAELSELHARYVYQIMNSTGAFHSHSDRLADIQEQNKMLHNQLEVVSLQAMRIQQQEQVHDMCIIM